MNKPRMEIREWSTVKNEKAENGNPRMGHGSRMNNLRIKQNPRMEQSSRIHRSRMTSSRMEQSSRMNEGWQFENGTLRMQYSLRINNPRMDQSSRMNKPRMTIREWSTVWE